mmetsp:Transcript_52706/g.111988  ORF Transcript_52706/g.111988 Transcript_52706/m.111988 type:complete len:253 (+) Transcript_52706:393-1151(+)
MGARHRQRGNARSDAEGRWNVRRRRTNGGRNEIRVPEHVASLFRSHRAAAPRGELGSVGACGAAGPASDSRSDETHAMVPAQLRGRPRRCRRRAFPRGVHIPRERRGYGTDLRPPEPPQWQAECKIEPRGGRGQTGRGRQTTGRRRSRRNRAGAGDISLLRTQDGVEHVSGLRLRGGVADVLELRGPGVGGQLCVRPVPERQRGDQPVGGVPQAHVSVRRIARGMRGGRREAHGIAVGDRFGTVRASRARSS